MKYGKRTQRDRLMRPTRDSVFIEVALTLSKLGTCARRQVGAVLVNKRHHIIATGYNGVAAGYVHCEGNHTCEAAQMKSGEGLELCEAIHAEQNALLQCRDVYDIDRIYSTTPPCLHCVKLLMNTSCNTIISIGDYPMSEAAEKLWLSTPSNITRHWKVL